MALHRQQSPDVAVAGQGASNHLAVKIHRDQNDHTVVEPA